MADNLHIQNPSITSGAFASMLAFSAGTDIITAISGHPVGGIGGGGGGTPAEGYWRPLYNDNTGDLSWLWSVESTANTPTPANIKGPPGDDGEQGPAGADGEDGFSPTVVTAAIPVSEEFPAGGTEVTITDSDGQHVFNISNGQDGQGATINLFGGEGIEVTKAGANYTISVSADYLTSAASSGSVIGAGTTNSPLTLKTSAEQALAAVDGKVSKPSPKQQQFSYVVWDRGPAQSWADFGAAATNWANNFLFDSESPIVNGINGLSAGLVPGEFSDVYEIGIATSGIDADTYYTWTTSGWKALQINISADGRLCSIGEDNVFVYEAGGVNDVLLQGYANSGTYEDFAQGFENSAFQYALVQGRYNKARSHSLAQGYHNIATDNSFAQGNENIAEAYSLAQGYKNSAVQRSLAQGITNTASGYSFAQGIDNIAIKYSLSQGAENRAETYSIAQGQGNRAFENSQAFGLSTIASGSSIDGHHYGMMSIGSYNATTAGALFVIGNGYSENSTDYRSDAFIVYKDGHVSAAGDIWANGVKLGAGGGGGIVGPTGTGSEDKYWLYSTYTGNSWIEANSWLCNNFICENGISGVPDMSLGKMHIGLSGSYLPTSGGTVSGDIIVKSTGNNILAVNTTATLMGQSRVANLTDTTAIGTNWLGVNSYGGGFLKNVQGGDVGALNGTSIQINFAPDGANSYGNITVDSQGNQSKVVHVPTASYNSMSSFDNTNGPNYMLRKTASGFDIGAAVINVTALPQQTEANAYYFVYDA